MISENTRQIETVVSLSNIEAQIAALLYATKTIGPNEDVIEFKMGTVNKEGGMPLSIKVKKQREVRLINHNG